MRIKLFVEFYNKYQRLQLVLMVQHSNENQKKAMEIGLSKLYGVAYTPLNFKE